MKKTCLKSFLLYLTLSSFVLGWWLAAFRNQSETSFEPPSSSLASLHPDLSLLKRDVLHQALAGNVRLMLQLISNWDSDAQILQSKQIDGIQRLPQETLSQAQLLGGLILESSREELRNLNCRLRTSALEDNNKRVLELKDSFCRFLPQTYVSASFLLAIAKPEEIIALPQGLRALPQLYPKDLLDQIPQNANRCNSEKLFLADPHVAFIAPYSHPSAIEALNQQKIHLFTSSSINSISDIHPRLLEIGHISNHPIEAQLLSIFIEAGMLSIDNRLKDLCAAQNSTKPIQILYLNYYQQYRMPTVKCLTGQLLARALHNNPRFKCTADIQLDEWQIPFKHEKIYACNPDYLILSIPAAHDSKARLKQKQMLQNLPACQKNQVAFLDEAIQDSPTQYIVLAYYDLYQALAGANRL